MNTQRAYKSVGKNHDYSSGGGLLGASAPVSWTWESTNLKPKAVAPPQVVADNFPLSSHNDSQKSSFKSSFWYVLFAPLFRRKRPVEAETARNSLSWTILQGTSLFSIFCSATLPVTSRKQGFCVQNRGGGTRGSSFAGYLFRSHRGQCRFLAAIDYQQRRQ